jgi:hypothetical protein
METENKMEMKTEKTPKIETIKRSRHGNKRENEISSEYRKDNETENRIANTNRTNSKSEENLKRANHIIKKLNTTEFPQPLLRNNIFKNQL